MKFPKYVTHFHQPSSFTQFCGNFFALFHILYFLFPSVAQLLEEAKSVEGIIRSIVQARLNDQGNYRKQSIILLFLVFITVIDFFFLKQQN